jgi:hypothetical protein
VLIRSKVLIAVALLAATRPARGQVLIGYLFGEKLASETFNMGFEIGINFSTLDGMGQADRDRKTVFGLFADWRFSEHFHFGAALLPIAGRGASGLVPVPTGDPALDEQTAGGTMARNLGYLEIPLLLRWAPKRETGFRAGVGPSFGIITSANDRYEATTVAGTPYVLERDIKDETASVDVGLSADVEWRFPMLSIAARYTHGLTDIDEGASVVKTRTLTGTGRIYLGKKKKAAPTISTNVRSAGFP